MTIANCPSCQEEVRVPGSTSEQATLECPWCGYQAVMTEFLKSSPPLLLVVNDPAVSDDRGLAFAIETEKPEDTPRFEFEERDAPQIEPMSEVTPAVVSRRPRPQPKGGGLISAAAIIFGGLCALPLAQLCLWWIFGRDPIEIGPKVPSYAAFLVPSKFRSNLENAPVEPMLPNSSGRGADSGTGLPESPFNRQGEQRFEPSNGDVAASSGSSAEELETDQGAVNSLKVPENSPGAEGSEGPPRRPMQFDGFAVTSEADISEALQRILVGFTTWSEAESIDDETRPARLQEFYNGYGELGELLAFADPGAGNSELWLGLIDTTLQSQLTDEQLLRFFGNKAKQKLDQPLAGVTGGIALAGRCESVERVGEFWKIRVRLGESKPKMVDVMAWVEPPRNLRQGDQVMVLGCRVADVESMGWESKDAVEAVLGGYLAMLTPAAR
ncbi:MAG: hypothetical protein VX757_03375 [Planctomycetota bacterium]|jgi:hypothetical protein|nr:hypothetical protein [Planctomycetota bacterium]